MPTSNTLELTLDNGKVLPLRSNLSKTGNQYWAVLAAKATGERYYNKRGVMVSEKVVGDTLPASITLLGETFPVTAGVSEKGKPKVTTSGHVHVPGHGRKHLSFRITEVGDKVFNVDAIVNGGSGSIKALDSL